MVSLSSPFTGRDELVRPCCRLLQISLRGKIERNAFHLLSSPCTIFRVLFLLLFTKYIRNR